MRLVPSMEDDLRRVRTFELDDGRLVRLDARDVERYGAAALVASLGITINQGKPVPVFQHGQMVGTVPFDFEPALMATRTKLFYDPRPGDFIRTKEGWEARASLGPGDLWAVVGFSPA